MMSCKDCVPEAWHVGHTSLQRILLVDSDRALAAHEGGGHTRVHQGCAFTGGVAFGLKKDM